MNEPKAPAWDCPTPENVIYQIDNFEWLCQQEEYTDTGDAWQLFNWIRDTMREDSA